MSNSDELIWQKWYGHYHNKPNAEAIIHITFDNEPFVWTYKSLFENAIKFSIILKKVGIKKGEVCGIIMKHNPNFYPIYIGVSLLGAVTSVLAYKNPRIHPEKFIKGFKGIAKHSGLDWVLTDSDMEDTLRPIIESETSTIKHIVCPLDLVKQEIEGEINYDFEIEQLVSEWDNVSTNEPFLLQHSSGTTGLQKGVTLSHYAILKHSESYGKSINLNENDRVVSWLPLYHDMGLIAAYTIPLIAGVTTIQIDPFDWIMEPVLLLEVISSHNATLTWLPNFAYLVLANKVHPEDITGLNLSSMRMFINCSEPVTKQAHQKFYDFYKNNGLNKNSLGVSYAMAETTFAVTQTLVGKAANVLLLDKVELANGKAIEIDVESEGNGRYCVSSGSTINGCEIKIVSEDGNILKDGYTGEVVIKSLSMFNGYKNNEKKSREVLKAGWYYSGDIGFCKNEEYYIIGRKKNIIIVAGKNLYPEDIEEIINTCEGVIPGRVVAFGIYNQEIGTDQVHVVVETLLDYVEHKKLSQLIISVAQINEISIACVHIKPSRWLFKSSSGKLSREDNKNRIIAELNLEI